MLFEQVGSMKMEKKVEEFINMPLGLLTERYYFIKDYLAGYGCEYHDLQSFQNYVSEEKDDFFLNIKMTRQEFACAFYDYLTQVLQAVGEEEYGVDSITIIAGKDKDGAKEQYDSIKLERGSITAIVGKTGSGKSRLLEDIEWAACGDTPTGRTVLLNEKEGNRNEVGKKKRKLIAQLSQNMNFVLDMSVEEFLRMHAACFKQRNIRDEEELVSRVWKMANDLSGEPFAKDISINRLSGGQSRALMIADCAILSEAPVILIDEIENAGINRRKALDLLTGEDKIVLIATHDPILALLSDRRLVIDNGGISRVIARSKEEDTILIQLEEMDSVYSKVREQMRAGEMLA